MKYIFKIFLFSYILFTALNANEQIKSKQLYLNYESYPKRVFTGQKFDITLKAVILQDENSYDKIITTFIDEKDIQIVTQKPIWVKQKKSIYLSKITFKTINSKFKMPTTTVALVKDDEIVDYLSIEPPKIIYEKIAVNQELFSNIIAKDLQVHTIKTKQYNNNLLLSTINIETTNGNLENIHLSKYNDQGIKSFNETPPYQTVYYYVMIPTHTTHIKFTYYNTDIKDFVMVSLPISLEEELVSTQTNLNPYNSNMLIYKRSATISLLLVFVILFFITKKDRYLVVITLTIAIVAYLFIPNEKIILEKGTKVYILPTKNSTVYKTLNSKEIIETINKTENFTKVLFENKNIGWVKSNDIK